MFKNLVSIPHDAPEKPLEGIDYIYLINLEDRKDRLQRSLDQLSEYGLKPQPFPAVSGNQLSAEVFEACGLKFDQGMEGDNWVLDYSHPDRGEFTFLNKQLYGKTFYSKRTSKGAIGCALSHLSAIQDAYNRGYQTIWILEDDCQVLEDPHILSKRLQELEGKEWDLLYTDPDEWPEDTPIGFPLEDLLWRPDMPHQDLSHCYKRSILDDHFMKVGLRFRTTSYIINRSGMKKMLDYFSRHHLFSPFDLEISLIPQLTLLNLRKGVVTHHKDEQSNIQERQWQDFKIQALGIVLPQNSSWFEKSKAANLMEFVHEKKSDQIVTAGFFSGTTPLAMALALSFNVKGKVHILFTVENALVEQLAKTSLQALKDSLGKFIQNLKLDPFCDFSPCDQPIDLLYLDNSFQGSETDLQNFFSKVRPGGYIFLNAAEHWVNRKPVSFLMEHATWLREKSLGIECVCFKK